jgi:hypothetical protein
MPATRARDLAARWRPVYVVTAMIVLYLSVFVLIVQAFEKVPRLRALAPTQSEPPVALTQLLVLVLFVALTIVAVILQAPQQP